MFEISVIICSYNPRRDYLRRVLDALQAQTLPKEEWELLLIDNASKEPLVMGWDLSWHPNARVIREDELGLTPARLRGIKESTGEILVFVDDDNVLASDYLEQVVELGRAWPMLGAWGGQSLPEFEIPPPEWTRRFWGMLALHAFEDDRWSNQGEDAALPRGAGMCVRRFLAVKYAAALATDQHRSQLDRKGSLLVSGGDTDLMFSVCAAGFGTGRIARLRLTHLIPARRLSEDYLAGLCEGMTYSGVWLNALHHKPAPPTRARRFVNWLRALTSGKRERRFRLAAMRGERAAWKALGQTANAIHGK
jgi:glycosyltransferase involved in cell wall biosynthesis